MVVGRKEQRKSSIPVSDLEHDPPGQLAHVFIVHVLSGRLWAPVDRVRHGALAYLAIRYPISPRLTRIRLQQCGAFYRRSASSLMVSSLIQDDGSDDDLIDAGDPKLQRTYSAFYILNC